MIWFTKTKKKAVRNIFDNAFVHLITFFRLQHHNLRTVIVCCSVPKMWFQQPWRQPVLQLEQQSPSSADQICNSSPSWICRTEPGSNFSQWNGVERTNLRQDSDWRRCFHNQHKNIWRLRYRHRPCPNLLQQVDRLSNGQSAATDLDRLLLQRRRSARSGPRDGDRFVHWTHLALFEGGRKRIEFDTMDPLTCYWKPCM